MVIYIDKSIGQALSSRELSEDEATFFARLAYLYQDGLGYLCGDSDSLSRLSQKLPGLEKGIYCALGAHYTESGVVINAVQKVLVLTFQQDLAALPAVLQKPEKALFIPVPNALEWTLWEKCCLLGENLNDCSFFQHVAAYYRSKHQLNGLRESFQRDNGGGSTTGSVLKERIQVDRRLTLCVVDSDRKYGSSKAYPNEPAKGDTYKQVKEVLDELVKNQTLPLYECFCLDVHEAENLIPGSLLRKLQVDCPEMAAGLDMLDRLNIIRDGTPALYYDLKNGFPYLASGPKRAYWQEILDELGGQALDMPPEKKAKQEGNTEPPQLFFPPVCKHLLERANKELERTLPVLDTYLEHYWETLGATVFTWGCASMPSSA